MINLSADYVIAGGGTAGCVLANRLSEDPAVTVILLEAGGEAKSFVSQIPAGYARLVGNPRFDWLYEADADPTTGDRVQFWSGGRMLGGGSSINGQVFIRGTPADYDYWRDSGASGWGYADVLPYFKRMETWSGPANAARGTSGPLSSEPMRDPHPFNFVFLEACRESGLPTIPDYNTGNMEGAYLTQVSQRGGWRCSTEKAYLRPARGRANLQVHTGVAVERVELEQGRAVAVVGNRNGQGLRIAARREIIVSGGAFGSPAILLRSGIGSVDAMRDAGVTPQIELRGVGRNFQEHPTVGVHKLVNSPSLNSATGPLDSLRYAWQFLSRRGGPLTASIVQAMALARTREGLAEPDIQLHFVPLSFDMHPDGRILMPKEAAVNITASICHPKSRGRVELAADGKPRIRHQFYSDLDDLDTLVEAGKLIERLFAMPSFARKVVGPRIPSTPLRTDAEWADYVRRTSGIAYHPVGTCKMGTDEHAVVDPSLKVRGVDALRVVDASIMPRVTSANTNATTIMIAEKAADMIRNGS